MSCKKNVVSSGLTTLINSYLSDDESKDEDDEEEKELSENHVGAERLPLPAAFLSRDKYEANAYDDDCGLHDGRVRSFPHERGNWASYIFVPCEASSVYNDFCDFIVSKFSHAAQLKVVPDPHISLTRTFVLLHHWIESFIKSVEQQLKSTHCFSLDFGKLAVYVNEEKTRTFIGLSVTTGICDLISSVEKINECLDEFRLPRYYHKPSFHMSFAWCLGNKKDVIERLLPELDISFRQFHQAHSELFTMEVRNFICKSGNKTYNLRLNDS